MPKKKLGDWLVRIANGDEGALAAVYKMVGGRLLSIAMGLTRNLQMAEDVLHDSFIKVARFAHQFKRGTNAYAWLCTIVRNTALNKIKSEKAKQGLDIDGFFYLSDGDTAEKSHIKILVETAMQTLSPRERTILWLKYFNDMTLGEMASELSIPKSTLQEAIKTEEKKLKAALQPDKNQ